MAGGLAGDDLVALGPAGVDVLQLAAALVGRKLEARRLLAGIGEPGGVAEDGLVHVDEGGAILGQGGGGGQRQGRGRDEGVKPHETFLPSVLVVGNVTCGDATTRARVRKIGGASGERLGEDPVRVLHGARRHALQVDDVVGPLGIGARPVAVEQHLAAARAVLDQAQVARGEGIAAHPRGPQPGRDVELVLAGREVPHLRRRPGFLRPLEPVRAGAADQHVRAAAGHQGVGARAALQRIPRSRRFQPHAGLGFRRRVLGLLLRRRRRSAAAGEGRPGQALGGHALQPDDIAGPLAAGTVGVDQHLGPALAVVEKIDVAVGDRVGPRIAAQQRAQVQAVFAGREVGDPGRRPGRGGPGEAVGARPAGQQVGPGAGVQGVGARAADQGVAGAVGGEHLARLAAIVRRAGAPALEQREEVGARHLVPGGREVQPVAQQGVVARIEAVGVGVGLVGRRLGVADLGGIGGAAGDAEEADPAVRVLQPLVPDRLEQRRQVLVVGLGGAGVVGVLLALAPEHRLGPRAAQRLGRAVDHGPGDVEDLVVAAVRPVEGPLAGVGLEPGAAPGRLDDPQHLVGMGGAEVHGELHLGAPGLRHLAEAGILARPHLLPGAGVVVPDQGQRVGPPGPGKGRGVHIGAAGVRLAGEDDEGHGCCSPAAPFGYGRETRERGSKFRLARRYLRRFTPPRTPRMISRPIWLPMVRSIEVAKALPMVSNSDGFSRGAAQGFSAFGSGAGSGAAAVAAVLACSIS
ncbi:tropoelastin [Phenylobacterium zucineum HLK1]|uniref:Tropoelastin n=1 Tax=Phenylobacterium zucineum (strain HLK1) TaxID=450851 RepID=B4RCB1_PHEZH|nr:tropoelastin [Phenylobacterium zucineum HLK1]